MAELKTSRNDDSVEAFLDAVPDERRRADARVVVELMRRVTGAEPAMWGDSIIGFGSRRLVYASGREIDWMEVGLSPRKAALTLYLNEALEERTELLDRLGPHTTGKGCLYLKRVEAVDPAVLTALLESAVAAARRG